jgi:hypothetical protein
MLATAKFKVELWLADIPRRTDTRNHLASCHFLASLHQHLIAVGIGRDPSVGVLDENKIAVTSQLISRIGDNTCIRSLNDRPTWGANVYPVIMAAVRLRAIVG